MWSRVDGRRVLRGGLIPIVVGLPGAGKSSIVRELAVRLGLPIFASDAYFRECRALPIRTDDPRREIMSRFLVTIAARFPGRLAAIQADAEGVDAGGQCRLHDGKYFRRHGEDVFRMYEIHMLEWAWSHGVLEGRIPDLSASAPLFEDNRRIFSIDHGYAAVLVDTPAEIICRNLLRDFARVEAARAAGQRATIRGAYEKLFDEALANQPPGDETERQHRLAAAAAAAVENEAAARLGIYRAFAVGTIVPTAAATPDALAGEILDLLGGTGS